MGHDTELDELDREPSLESDDFARRVGRASPAPVPWQALAGDVIAERYVIEAKIGEGGLGVVYRAVDPILKRNVAIKLLGVVEDEQAFLREARATARVLHPNVVTIHDCGTESRTAFLVLELLEGKTLAQRVAGRGAMPLAEALPLLSDVASALTRAHDNLVTHRDLSWNNVFVTEDELVKVLDFGFAELAEQRRKKSNARRFRAEDAGCLPDERTLFGGTPGFAPPEQLEGVDVAFKGDLFSLGVLVFRLLTGVFPFRGDTLDAYRASLATTVPPRLHERLPGALRKLDDLVASLLEKNPDGRPATKEVRDLLRELRDEHASPGKKLERLPSLLGEPVRELCMSETRDEAISCGGGPGLSGLDVLRTVRDDHIEALSPLASASGEPFRPLCAFEAADEQIFFGRDRELETLEGLVNDERLVVLHGVSGAGKSSLVRAGLLPRLGHRFFVIFAEIGADPTRTPVEQLVEHLRAELEWLGQTSAERDVDVLLAAIGQRVKKEVLLVLDQFGEIFLARTQERFQREALELGRVLQRVVEMAEVEARVLIVIRTDYHGYLECLKPTLPSILAHGMLLLPLGADSTRKAIEGPFEAAGFEVPRGLVEEMIVDLTQDGAVNPVELQLVCHALYERATETGRRVLERDDYNRLGGAGKVLGEHIAQIEKEWPPERVRTARAILLRLVGKDGARTAAMSASELARATGCEASEIDETLEALRKARIVVPSALPEGSGHRIGHDKMALAVWERLGAEERRAVALRDVLRALKWKATGFRFLLRWWGLDDEDRAALLMWYEEGAHGADEEDRAYLAQGKRWAKRATEVERLLWLVCVTAVFMLIYGTNLLQVKDAQNAEAHAKESIESDPGKAIAYIVVAAEKRRGWIEATAHQQLLWNPEDSYDEHWLLTIDAWQRGIGWVATQHGREVTKVIFSPPEENRQKATGAKRCENCWPNRKLLFSAGRDGTVRMLDLDRGGQAQVLPGKSETALLTAVISPNGEWLAAGDAKGTLHVWTWRADTAVWEHREHEPPERSDRLRAVSMAITADGKRLVVGCHDGILFEWDTSNWKGRKLENRSKHTIDALAFSPKDGSLIALDEIGELSDDTGRILGKLTTVRDRPSIVITGDGARLRVYPMNEVVDIAPIHEDAAVPDERPDPQQDEVFCQVQSLDSEWIGRSMRDGSIVAEHAPSGNRRVLMGPEAPSLTIAISPDNRLLASGDGDGHVYIWSIRDGMTWKVLDNNTRSVLIDGPESEFIAGLENGRIVAVKPSFPHASRDLYEGEGHDAIRGLCKTPHGRVVASFASGKLFVLDQTGKKERESRHGDKGGEVLCLKDGTIVQAAKNNLLFWPPDGGEPETLGPMNGTVTALALIDDEIVISATHEGALASWNARSKTKLAETDPSHKYAFSLAFVEHDDVVVGLDDGNVWRWSWSGGEPRPLGLGHGGIVRSVATLGGSRLMATGANDGTVRLAWVDFSGNGNQRIFPGHTGKVRALVFSAEGRSLISAGTDGVRIFPLPPTERERFNEWLDKHSPWTIRDGVPVANGVPPFADAFGEP